MVTDSDNLLIRPATRTDAAAIARIYNYYVTETIITFEEDPVSSTVMARRIENVQSALLPWLVAVQDDNILGFACAGRWRKRSAYRFSVETTVYLDTDKTGRGLGTGLYGSLLPLLSGQNIHTAIGGIALPNEASVALHEKLNFEKVAHFNKVGFKFNRWIDVGYWQREL